MRDACRDATLHDAVLGLLVLPGVLMIVIGTAYVEAINELAERWS